MRVLAHIDPLTLERRALSLIAAAVDRAERLLVLVPSRRLADHLQVRMLEERAAWVGVEVLDLGRLATAILERDGRGALPRGLSERLRSALVDAALGDVPRTNVWRARTAGRGGTARRLRAAFDDLREAGIGSVAVAAAAEDDTERDLAEIYSRYAAALDAVADEVGRADLAHVAAAAVEPAPRFGRRFDTILLHGASEVIGVHLDLLRALDAVRPLTALVPAHPEGRGTVYARRFAATHFVDEPGTIEWLAGDAARTERLAALYDEEARPTGPAPWTVACAHAQGAAAEVRLALRRELSAIDAGCPPQEILVVVRDAATHLAALEEAFEEAGIPWSASARSPLRREPAVRDALLLLDAVARDFPRALTAEMLRSPRFRWSALTGGRPPGERLDRLSREARLIGGLDEWRDVLPAWLEARADERADGAPAPSRHRGRRERDTADAGAAAAALTDLTRRLAPGESRSWGEHATAIADLLGSLLPDDDRGERSALARAALAECVADMARMGRLPGFDRAVPFDRARRWLEDAVDGAVWAPDDRDRGGLRVLDAMQARGLTARRVVLLGMNAGAFPRRGAPDPVLDDGLRVRLREATGRPLGVRVERVDEERGLLTQMLGAARAGLAISWQRSDESGRARSPSLALREIARAVAGRPDPSALAAEYLSSHPLEWLGQVERLTGVLSADDEAIMLALRGRGPDALELAARHPELAPGLAMLRETESYEPGPTDYDGAAGGVAPRTPLSVSSLDRLGNCPLRFFFERVLRVRELDLTATPWELQPREMGSIAHEALQHVYRALAERDAFAGTDPAAVTRAAADDVPAAFDRAAGSLIARLRGRLPVLWDRERRAWIEALRTFVRDDLERLLAAAYRPLGFERRVEGTLEFAGHEVAVTGRFDREFEGPAGRLVGDYKTSRKLRCSTTEMLRGRELQVPLYRRLAGDDARVELLRVGPGRTPDTKSRAEFAGFASDEAAATFDATMGVLLDVIDRGRYPLRHDDRICGSCPFDRACRHRHPPTVERDGHAPDAAAYHALDTIQRNRRR